MYLLGTSLAAALLDGLFEHPAEFQPETLNFTFVMTPEMREHHLFTKQTKMRVYFAHPHCPWDRGTNENANGLLRHPKGTRVTQVSRAEIKRVQVILNDRPQKIMNWHSPAHAFHYLLH